MKKRCILCALLLLLTGCRSLKIPSDAPSTTTTSASTTASTTTSTTTSTTASTTTTRPKPDFVNKTGVPLVFIDGTNYPDQAYYFGSIVDGKWCALDAYAYDDCALDDYLLSPETEVDSPALPSDSTLTFIDGRGAALSAISTRLQVQGEGRVISGIAEVRATLNTETDGWWLGTTDPSIFPSNVTYGERNFTADMNGRTISVSWEFTPTEADFVRPTVTVVQEGEIYTITHELLSVKEDEWRVFLLDINGDGQCEIFTYARHHGRFGVITLYQISDGQYTILDVFDIDPMP